MKLLLDTHAFIWWDSAPSQLSATALAHCTDPAHEVLLVAQARLEAAYVVTRDPAINEYVVSTVW